MFFGKGVKKYPLYLLDKLNEEFPDIGRHSIQRILEKKDLSTVKKRVAFAQKNKDRFSFLLKLQG